MGEQNTITISADEYSVLLGGMTRLDILRGELIAIYDEYVDDKEKDRLLRIVGIDVETRKKTEAVED